MKKPLDGFAVGLVAELTGELENSSSTKRRHPGTAAAAIHFGVAVFGGGPLGRGLLRGLGRRLGIVFLLL